jgi:hypothetical protein
MYMYMRDGPSEQKSSKAFRYDARRRGHRSGGFRTRSYKWIPDRATYHELTRNDD